MARGGQPCSPPSPRRPCSASPASAVAVEVHVSNGLPGFTIVWLARRCRVARRATGCGPLSCRANGVGPNVGSRSTWRRPGCASPGPASIWPLPSDCWSPMSSFRPTSSSTPGSSASSASRELDPPRPRRLPPVDALDVGGRGRGARDSAIEAQLDRSPRGAGRGTTLAELLARLAGDEPWRPLPSSGRAVSRVAWRPTLADVRGQAVARYALEVAAAGGHHLLMTGPPG